MKEQKNASFDVVCGLRIFTKCVFLRILEELVKLLTPFPSQGLFVVDIWF